MGVVRKQKKVVLLAGIFSIDADTLEFGIRRLEKRYGTVRYRSEIFPVTQTGYYREEMGADLIKRFICFDTLMDMEELSGAKLAANDIEADFTDNRRGKPGRILNIDPGYQCLSKVILATTKDYDHRIYLGRGIFAEITLRYKAKLKRYTPMEWTYPDYQTPLALDFFGRVREWYKGMIDKGAC